MGYSAGGYVSQPNAPAVMQPNNTAALERALTQTAAVNAALLNQLQQGIQANVSVSGSNGIKAATDTYNKLLKNANR